MSGGLPDYTKRVRIGLGSVAANLIGGPGTVSNKRIPTISSLIGTVPSSKVGTYPANRTYGTYSANRVGGPGTIDSSRIPTTSGTLSGARSAGSLVRGTLNNARLTRSPSFGTVTAVNLSAGSLGRGTVPIARLGGITGRQLGSLGNPAPPGMLLPVVSGYNFFGDNTVSGVAGKRVLSADRAYTPFKISISRIMGYWGSVPTAGQAFLAGIYTVGTTSGFPLVLRAKTGTIRQAKKAQIVTLQSSVVLPPGYYFAVSVGSSATTQVGMGVRAFGSLYLGTVPPSVAPSLDSGAASIGTFVLPGTINDRSWRFNVSGERGYPSFVAC